MWRVRGNGVRGRALIKILGKPEKALHNCFFKRYNYYLVIDALTNKIREIIIIMVESIVF